MALTWQWFDRAPESFLGQPLNSVLQDGDLYAIRQCIAGDFEHANPIRISLETSNGPYEADCIAHCIPDNVLILEIEPDEVPVASTIAQQSTYFDFFRQIKAFVVGLQRATSFDELCTQLVESVRRLTQFDRVMIYRFDVISGAGAVIAEARHPDVESYLGLRYPATDIPKQARHLYVLNRLRIIPDATYTPVPLVPVVNPLTQSPLDLTWSVLRSVSPMHTEYLHNMGVGASMSISLVNDSKLWGLIACHHRTPKQISYFQRTVCEFISQIASFELAAKSEHQDQAYRIELNGYKTSFLDTLSQSNEIIDAIQQAPTALLKLVGATGVAVYIEDKHFRFGNTPSSEQLESLIAYLQPRLETDDSLQTPCLSHEYPDAIAYSSIASGLLAIKISHEQRFYILWFRPEVIQTVTWGGDPNKPVSVASKGEARLSPRKSFSAWQEIVRHTAIPWKPCELEMALEVRSALINLVLRHAAEISQLNQELKRSNLDLDAFAYIASHDLKEPLRGIHNYSTFLIEDYGSVLDEEGVSKLAALTRLTRRMQDLIDSLLYYSRLGRSELLLYPIDLHELAIETAELFKITGGNALEITIHPLPTVLGDRSLIYELLTNLVSNAIKYNNSPCKKIEIGCCDPTSSPPSHAQSVHTIYIRDNGIGIHPQHHQDIFRIFRRLHLRQDYGGGIGAGLTIAQKIVERHGGTIWVESVEGTGSTFYFTLPKGSPTA
ncbi:MAG TPA: ATP-binding protein [Stenomitos sp.]